MQTLYKYFLTGSLLLGISFAVLANDHKAYRVGTGFGSMVTIAVSDTIPPKENKKPEETTGNKPEEVIKEVPKSRKQVKPLAVTTIIKVKPVIVKPKIVVKPIIKLH